jgi:hypothetical protein
MRGRKKKKKEGMKIHWHYDISTSVWLLHNAMEKRMKKEEGWVEGWVVLGWWWGGVN